MSKLIDKPIKVQVSGTLNASIPNPVAFRYRDSTFAIRVVEEWKDTGEWWNDEAEKIFYRVAAASPPDDDGRAGARVFEIYQDTRTKRWYLYKAYD